MEKNITLYVAKQVGSETVLHKTEHELNEVVKFVLGPNSNKEINSLSELKGLAALSTRLEKLANHISSKTRASGTTQEIRLGEREDYQIVYSFTSWGFEELTYEKGSIVNRTHKVG